MLIFSLGSSTTTVGTVSSTSFFNEYTLAYRFDRLCTFFDHDATQDSFTGIAAIGCNMFLEANFLGVSEGTTVTADSSSMSLTVGFPLTVLTGTFDTIAGTGSCQLAGTMPDAPLLSYIVSDTYSSVDALFYWDPFELDGTTGVTGFISGELTFYNTASSVVTASPRLFSIVRGELCGLPGGDDTTTIGGI